MEEPYDSIAKILFGVCIGGLLANLFIKSRERYFRRQHFRSFIELLEARVKSRTPEFFGSMIRDSELSAAKGIPELEKAALAVRPYIHRSKRNGFDGACAAYKRISFGFGNAIKANAEAKEELLSILEQLSSYAR